MTTDLNQMHQDMPADEKAIALKVIEDAIEQGYTISVHDGLEVVVTPSNDPARIFAAMYSTGSDTLRFYKDGKFFKNGQYAGYVWLVWGNGRDLLSDWSFKAEPLLDGAMKLAESF